MRERSAMNRGLAWTSLAISASVLSIVFLAANLYYSALSAVGLYDRISVWLFHISVGVLLLGNITYLVSRFSYFLRLPDPENVQNADFERIYDQPAHELVMLVPSFKEESDVIRQTLLSAALMEHSNRHIVLLIDDPPHPAQIADRRKLESARRIPQQIQESLETIHRPLQLEYAGFRRRQSKGTADPVAEQRRLSVMYERAAKWLDEQAERHLARCRPSGIENSDRFFVAKILTGPAERHRQRARSLSGTVLPMARIEREYVRLVSLFSAQLSSFERKRYVNLPHAANKAMNLNAYLNLLGRSLRAVETPDGLLLEDCPPAAASLRIPNAHYVGVLDADSLLLPDYAIRLVHVLEQPGNERIGLAQTPYSAIPSNKRLLEDVAGATTDIYYPIHQGLCANGAAFWVGPNSIKRRVALEDIAEMGEERGYPFKVFVRDRTAIEDTDTTIDLLSKGWHLYSYMARLAYSATPPDFGALVIQRERWANGGLLLLPKLLRYLCQGPFTCDKTIEAFLRFTNLVAPAMSGLAMMILIFFCFDDRLIPTWLPLISLPYFILLAQDLKEAGYHPRYLPSVYSLNLLLLPVLVGGTLLSLRQAYTGRRANFNRTPRVCGGTPMPLVYSIAIYTIFYYAAFWAIWNLSVGSFAHAAIAAVVASAYFCGISAFIGGFKPIRVPWRLGQAYIAQFGEKLFQGLPTS
jgi:cellulose synthase (UDP-forming)